VGAGSTGVVLAKNPCPNLLREFLPHAAAPVVVEQSTGGWKCDISPSVRCGSLGYDAAWDLLRNPLVRPGTVDVTDGFEERGKLSARPSEVRRDPGRGPSAR
jgi:hypothetical protein